MWLQDGTTFNYTTIAYGTPPVIAASPTTVGGSSDVNSVLRVAALACFTGLTGVQAMQCAKFVQDEVTARGIDFATPAPNMPA